MHGLNHGQGAGPFMCLMAFAVWEQLPDTCLSQSVRSACTSSTPDMRLLCFETVN